MRVSRFRKGWRARAAVLATIGFMAQGEAAVLAETLADPPAQPPAPAAEKAPAAQTTTGATGAAPPADKAPAAQTTTGGKAAAAPAGAPEQAPKIANDQLDSLVAPIALYPDALLAQVLVASTYPLELVQLQQWLAKNKELKDKALSDAVAKQPWDTSIQSMAPFPDVVKRLVDDIQWTTDLGNAFLSQQSDVMDAVQRMRKKAQEKGALKTNEQMKVKEEKAGEPPKEVIVIESSNPEVIYVPSYSPTVVYGPPVYPYPPIYYPPYPPGGMFLSFSFGVMWGAAIWGGSCCGCGWGGNDVDINVNNNFNKNEINTGGGRGDSRPKDGAGGNRGGASAGTSDRGGGAGNKAGNKAGGAGGGGGKWQHNPQHRGGTPYADKGTANKYGGNARGDSLSQRQSKAGGGPSAGNMSAGGRGGAGGGASAGNMSAGGRGGGSGGFSGGGGGDRVGNRDIGSSSGRSGGFGGGSGGFSGSSARASSSRGSRSMGGGGGGRRR